jgi:hypothetical protein
MSNVMFVLLLLRNMSIRTVSLSLSQSQHNQHGAIIIGAARRGDRDLHGDDVDRTGDHAIARPFRDS